MSRIVIAEKREFGLDVDPSEYRIRRSSDWSYWAPEIVPTPLSLKKLRILAFTLLKFNREVTYVEGAQGIETEGLVSAYEEDLLLFLKCRPKEAGSLFPLAALNAHCVISTEPGNKARFLIFRPPVPNSPPTLSCFEFTDWDTKWSTDYWFLTKQKGGVILNLKDG